MAWPRAGLGPGLAGLALLVSGAGCPDTGSADPSTGCTADLDCKGDRICEAGRCVNPRAEAGAASPASAATAESATDPEQGPRAWTRGGPGLPWPSPFEGPAATPKLAWDIDLGTVVFGTPAIVTRKDLGADVAYVGTHGGRFVGVIVSGPRASERVLDLDFGARMWGKPAVDEAGILYVGADDDTLRAIDPKSGDVKWSLKLGDCDGTNQPGPEGARCDVDGGPTLGPDGALYVAADGLYKIERSKGEVLWHWPPDEEDRMHAASTPVVDAKGRVRFGDQAGYINAVDERGETLWRYKVGPDVDGAGILGSDGTFYVGADDGRVYALRSDGSLKWSFVAQRDIRSALAHGPNEEIYVTSFDHNLYALAEDGSVKWVLPTEGIIASSPVVDAAGRIYFGSQDDHLYAVAPTGKVSWRYAFEGDVDASVAIASDGTLVVGGDDGHLRALSTTGAPGVPGGLEAVVDED